MTKRTGVAYGESPLRLRYEPVHTGFLRKLTGTRFALASDEGTPTSRGVGSEAGHAPDLLGEGSRRIMHSRRDKHLGYEWPMSRDW